MRSKSASYVEPITDFARKIALPWKTCLKCNRKNHFQQKCTLVGASANAATNSQDSHLQVQQVDDDTSPLDEERLNTVGSGGRDLKCCMLVGGNLPD